MCNLLGEDLLPAGSSVDAHHGHADGPGGVPYRHLEVGIVCLTDVGREGGREEKKGING